MTRRAHLAASVAWPAFLAAAVLEIVVFAFVDPAQVHTLRGATLGVSDTTVYSLAFFGFWAVASVAGWLTIILNRSAEEINRQPLAGH